MKGNIEFKTWSAEHNGSVMTEFRAYRRGKINPSSIAKKGNLPPTKQVFINNNGQVVETDDKGREIILRANTRRVRK